MYAFIEGVIAPWNILQEDIHMLLLSPLNRADRNEHVVSRTFYKDWHVNFEIPGRKC